MERRLQNSLWALGAVLTTALLLGGNLRPVPADPVRIAPAMTAEPGAVATGAAQADAAATPAPRAHKPLRRHGLSMPYFSFSSSIGG